MLLALGVVLGIMWALAKFARRPLTGKTDRVVTVLARQQLNRNASVAVLKIMDRALVVGVTESGVRLLAETDLEPIEQVLVDQRPAAGRRRARALPVDPELVELAAILPPEASAEAPLEAVGASSRSALDGSVLSPKMWSQLVNAARDVTVRR
ncbi:hypothetical protein BH10ACT8_BH10ACT8_00540 [soil metagenome]